MQAVNKLGFAHENLCSNDKDFCMEIFISKQVP